MIDMPKINSIRSKRAHGESIAEIAREEGVSEPTVRKYLKQEDFSPKPPLARERSSILDPYKDFIEEILDEDARTWHKQRHSSRKIYERLCLEGGYQGSYTTVQAYVRRRKAERSNPGEQYLDLVWHPGEVQIDFGTADFRIRGVVTKMHFLVACFPNSNVGLAQIMPGENAECVCEGLKAIFSYIGGVPTRLVFDNATGVGRKMGNTTKTSALFTAFVAHYGFDYTFCNPYAGHEKGAVENKVGALRRNLLVPMPKTANVKVYNNTLLERCFARSNKPHYSKGINELELFKQDKQALHPLPSAEFNAVSYERMKCDKYGKICLGTNHYYTVGPEYGRREVIVGKGAFTVDICTTAGELLATYERAYGKAPTESSDPSLQLALLCEKQNAWQNSKVRDSLPDDLRKAVDAMDKAERGAVLRCLRDVSAESGYTNAVNATAATIKTFGKLKQDEVEILARLAADGREPVVYEQEVGLSEYDQMFGKKVDKSA